MIDFNLTYLARTHRRTHTPAHAYLINVVVRSLIVATHRALLPFCRERFFRKRNNSMSVVDAFIFGTYFFFFFFPSRALNLVFVDRYESFESRKDPRAPEL